MVKTKSKPFFSILLPTYNRDDVVSFAIESILSQTFKDFELLIVGDGCTDNTERIVEKFILKDSRVRWFPFKKDLGFGYKIRNEVLKKAKGKYLAFLGHDDLWFPDHLERIFSFYKSNPDFKLVYTRPVWVHPDGTMVVSSFNTNISKVKKAFLEKYNEIPAACVIHDMDSARKVGFLNTRLDHSADWDMWKRIINLDSKKKIGFIPTATTLHFKAQWRTLNNFWNNILATIYREIKKSPYLSGTLKIQHSKKAILQEEALKCIQNASWVTRIREDFLSCLDLFFYDLANIKTQNSQLTKDIRRITSTKGYRLLEGSRKLIKRI